MFCSVYVADPATFLDSTAVLGTLFPPENTLFVLLISEFVLFLINIVNIKKI